MTSAPSDPRTRALATMTIGLETGLDAMPSAVFNALTDGIGWWWGAPYLMSAPDTLDLTLEARPGGLMLEQADGQNGAVWGMVEEVKRHSRLVLSGRMSMSDAVCGVVRFDLAPACGGTRLTLTHTALGRLDDRTQERFEAGWRDLLMTRLKAYVETGQASGVRLTSQGKSRRQAV